MPDDFAKIRCSREGCHPENGSGCIDGLNVDDCPNHYNFPLPEDADEIEATVQEPVLPSGIRQLHNGDALDITEANRMLRAGGGIVVSFIGCPDAGKTTVASMLYELIKRKKIGTLGFAGSYTLRGFQSRSFHSLYESGRTSGATERTKKSLPVGFLHLKVAPDFSAKSRFDIYLVDRSGEDFEDCLKSPKLCASFEEINRADCHVLIVDGMKLLNPDLANAHIADIRRILLALIQFCELTSSPLIQVVLTKLDEVIVSERKVDVERLFENFVREVKQRMPVDSKITSHKLAARPSSGTFYLGLGLEDLVREWLPLEQTAPFRIQVPTIKEGTHFEMLVNTVRY